MGGEIMEERRTKMKQEEKREEGFINVLERTIDRVHSTSYDLFEKVEEINAKLFTVDNTRLMMPKHTPEDESYTETMLTRLDAIELALARINNVIDKIVQL